MERKKKQYAHKLVAVVGPTASGKTALAIALARRFNGEVVSADSRQVYRGMDLGTGKTPKDNAKRKTQNAKPKGKQQIKLSSYISDGIVHHLIDVASPKRQFSVARYQHLASHAIKNIAKRGKLPIICGGTGQYVDAVVLGRMLPAVPPNYALRKKLENFSPAQLFAKLKILDPRRARNIDRHNPRRLVRALEIVITTKKPVPALSQLHPRYNMLWLGLNPQRNVLQKRIRARLLARLKQGMYREVERLYREGLSWTRLDSFGLEYRFVSRYLKAVSLPCPRGGYRSGGRAIQEQQLKNEMMENLYRAICNYAKRQMTWWRRNKSILWVKNSSEAIRVAQRFLHFGRKHRGVLSEAESKNILVLPLFDAGTKKRR